MNVLIAGGGPTGLTLGIDLARRGVDVRIVDKATTYCGGSRGDGIQPRTLEVFEDIGVLDAVLAAGSPQPTFRAYVDGRLVAERRMSESREPTPAVPYPNPWVLGQARTEGILRERLAEFGVRVELGTELIGLSQNDDGVTVTLSTGETSRFDYLVGADGGGSFVRKALGVAFEGTTDESIRMLLGDVRAKGLDPAYGYWFARASDPMSGTMLSPLPGTGLFQFGTPLVNGHDASLATLQGNLDALSAGVRLTELTWSTVWRPNVRLARRFRVGRVFLAGDAAHVHPPTGGQGLNTGVQDAYNLGWKLASQSDLDTYETERREVAARVLGVSSTLLRKHTEGDAEAHQRGEETFGLDISYRSPSASGELVPGDRAPDAPVVDANGKPIRLFDLFRGPHFTHLAFGEPAPAEPHAYAVLRPGARVAGPFVVDVNGHAFAAYEGTSVLVRPDGYLR